MSWLCKKVLVMEASSVIGIRSLISAASPTVVPICIVSSGTLAVNETCIVPAPSRSICKRFRKSFTDHLSYVALTETQARKDDLAFIWYRSSAVPFAGIFFFQLTSVTSSGLAFVPILLCPQLRRQQSSPASVMFVRREQLNESKIKVVESIPPAVPSADP